MRARGIDYVPGCADLGDFDATSTTIALAPTGAARLLPPAALQRTFEKYDEFFHERRTGAPWEAFTPYEIRNIGAYAHLGWRRRIPDLLQFFLDAQQPPGWRQWPEVVWHEPRTPRFVGDLPHTWVGSDWIRSVLDMLAWEREEDDALVLGAGVPLEWLQDPGIELRDLRTRWGRLGYTMRHEGDRIVVRINAGLRVPAGGIVVQPGDVILGDDDGLVVVGRCEAESVLEKALQRVEAEAKKSAQLRSGISSVELNKLGKVFEALGLVEE